MQAKAYGNPCAASIQQLPPGLGDPVVVAKVWGAAAQRLVSEASVDSPTKIPTASVSLPS